MKAGATVRTEDLSGLRSLANLLGDRFVAGFVLHRSADAPLGEELPVDALWRLAP